MRSLLAVQPAASRYRPQRLLLGGTLSISAGAVKSVATISSASALWCLKMCDCDGPAGEDENLYAAERSAAFVGVLVSVFSGFCVRAGLSGWCGRAVPQVFFRGL